MSGQLSGDAVTERIRDAALDAELDAALDDIENRYINTGSLRPSDWRFVAELARGYVSAATAAPAIRAQGAAAERDRIRREAQDHRDDCDQSEHRCCLDTALDDLLDGDYT